MMKSDFETPVWDESRTEQVDGSANKAIDTYSTLVHRVNAQSTDHSHYVANAGTHWMTQEKRREEKGTSGLVSSIAEG